MATTAQSAIAVIGIDIGKNWFHVVGLDGRGAIVLRQKWVAWPGRSTLCQYVPVSDRHGGLCRCPSPQSQAQGAGAKARGPHRLELTGSAAHGRAAELLT
jgi:hypothetical protein